MSAKKFPAHVVEGHNLHDPVNLPEHLCIGKEMHNFIYELQRHGSHILKLLSDVPLDKNVTDLLEQYIHQYSRQSCKIAVVGQMKAGKSAFINALIGRKNLLPSDINPWTSVVTRLHFGVAGKPAEGAKFRFFDQNEWQAIANGGGKLRQLVERFLPGFETDKLQQKLAEMRSHAERHFGNHLHDFLGKSHGYNQISPKLLEQYVCAGNDWDDEETAGRYSDITKSADVFFKASPFLYPTTIIDTPGTNDPFFVRDELTYRNLDEADIFVVVLPAQQAFSISDLALLRILQGLQKDRIVIFINRIDQLENIKNDTRDIVAHVQYMLKKEFPNSTFPIIAGSALWGQQALDDEGYAELNLDNLNTGEFFQAEDLLENERMRSKLYSHSGIPEIASAISKLMLKGKGRNSVGTITSNLKLATDNMLAVLKNQLRSLQSVQKKTNNDIQLTDAEIHAIRSKLEFLQEYTSKSNYYHIQYAKRLDNLREIVIDTLRTTLNGVVDDFARIEVKNLLDSLQKGKQERTWNCNTHRIRQHLEQEFAIASRDMIVKINAIQEAAAEELKTYLNNTAIQIDTSFIQSSRLTEEDPYMSSMVLKHVVALDLDQSWWKLWGSRKRKQEDWARELDQLVKTEFYPMVNRLVESAGNELNKLIDDSNRNFSAISKTVANILMERVYELQVKSDSLLEKGRQQQEFTERNNDKLQNYELKFSRNIECAKQTEMISRQLEQLSVRYQLLCRGTTVHAVNVK